MTIYDTAPSISTLKRDTKRYAAPSETSNHFIKDLGMPLDAQVRTSQLRTLCEAINCEIELYNRLNDITIISTACVFHRVKSA